MPDDDLSQTDPNGTTTDDAGEPQRVPVAALQKERQRRQELEDRLASIEREQAEKAAKEAAERGEFQRLYETEAEKAARLASEVEELRTFRQGHIERTTARNESRLERLPEALRSLAPEGMDPDGLASWLDRAEASATQPTFAAGTRTQGGGEEPIPDWVKAEAAKHGKDPKWWFEKVAKRTDRYRKWQREQQST